MMSLRDRSLEEDSGGVVEGFPSGRVASKGGDETAEVGDDDAGVAMIEREIKSFAREGASV